MFKQNKLYAFLKTKRKAMHINTHIHNEIDITLFLPPRASEFQPTPVATQGADVAAAEPRCHTLDCPSLAAVLRWSLFP